MRALKALIPMAAVLLSACNEPGVPTLDTWVAQVGPERTKVISEIPSIPYRAQEQQDFKTYFSAIEAVGVALAQNPGYAKGFNDALARVNLSDLCGKVFVSREDWQSLVNGCTKNGFFLCSDEVRFGPDLVAGIRAKLNSDLQGRFDQAASCRGAL